MSLEEYLKERGIWFEFVEKKETVHTADAAAAAGIELSRVTKNLVSRAESGEYFLLVVPGDKRVDLKKAAVALAVKNVALVPFEEAEAISGYPPGATPTIGHRMPMKIAIERTLLDYDVIYCGGGRRDRLLALRPEDILRVAQPAVADLIKE